MNIKPVANYYSSGNLLSFFIHEDQWSFPSYSASNARLADNLANLVKTPLSQADPAFFNYNNQLL